MSKSIHHFLIDTKHLNSSEKTVMKNLNNYILPNEFNSESRKDYL